MMVTFVSQCQKNALKKSRRVLDAYANRIGDNTWQTVITNEGLSAVKKLLRKTASKNTAVSCHWLRSRSRSELVWVVGNREKFNYQGVVPVNSTRRHQLDQENNWQQLPLIQALVAIAALFHDWGKASDLFQQKLKPDNKHSFKGDPIRHEWISCLLLSAFIRQTHSSNDEDWLNRLALGELDEVKLKQTMLNLDAKNRNPFEDLPPLGKWVAWLIVSHHRLPNLSTQSSESGDSKFCAKYYQGQTRSDIDSLLAIVSKEWGYENRYDEDEYQQRIDQCFSFSLGFLSTSTKWLAAVKKWALRLEQQTAPASQALADGSWRLVLTHARLCLMLGDHYYSSQDAAKKWTNTTGLYANTDRETNSLKQQLDEHLVGVSKAALQNAYHLPQFEHALPLAEDINSLKKPSPRAFAWQDKAVRSINEWRAVNTHQHFGFFAVNMASTGCGKTFANAKIMRALSTNGDTLRYTLALGLRTLTLQTGDEYRERIGLDDSELAVLIGSNAVLELHQANKKITEEKGIAELGSESAESLLDEDVDFDSPIPEEGLATLLTGDKQRKFLYAPVLSCTIDHLMSATECSRGGRYILPSLRMMSADLVIDEIDDFSGDDLVAIGRLIFLAGMLGRKVMISSATIPPDLAEGYFKAYRDGWLLYAKSRNIPPVLACTWTDEFKTHTSSNSGADIATAIPEYRKAHQEFIHKRVMNLGKQIAKRKATIAHTQSIIDQHSTPSNKDGEAQSGKQAAYFKAMASQAKVLHRAHHTKDKATGLKVSFGVIRMANIAPCINLSRYLLEEYKCHVNTEIRVMCYHSQQVLLLRAEQEQHLDRVLKRKEQPTEEPAAFCNKIIRTHLNDINKKPKIQNVLFILVATPVEEVGRDHDFDWAVIEPSSYRSIIQLAGRVRRHRETEISSPNIAIMQHNLKAIKQGEKLEQAVFEKPGYETQTLLLKSHDICDLLESKDIEQRLDAVPRIQKKSHQKSGYFRELGKVMPPQSLAELEHASIWRGIADYASSNTGPNSFQGYLRECWWLTGLPQAFFRFRDGAQGINTYLTYLHEQEEYKFCEKDEQGFAVDRQKVLRISHYQLTETGHQRLWLERNYPNSVKALADEQEQSLRRTSLRYGELNFLHNENKQYIYNDQLGLVKE